jgi:1,4-alpha-glucan branching enzyme
VRWSDGSEGRYADAYAFGLVLPDDALEQVARGAHPRPGDVLGARPVEIDGVAGVRFALQAPEATHASLVGDFNGWDVRRHPMRYRYPSGTWEIFVPHAAAGDLYKFALTGPDGHRLPDMADPFARAGEDGPGGASRVAAAAAAEAPLPAEGAPSHNRSGTDRQEQAR